MKIKKSTGSKVFDCVNIIFLSLFTLSVLYPFVYMFSQSISDYVAVGRGEIVLFPKGIQWDSYKTVLGDSQIFSEIVFITPFSVQLLLSSAMHLRHMCLHIRSLK